MTVTLDLPEAAQARLQAEATRRGITLDQLIAEIADSFPRRAGRDNVSAPLELHRGRPLRSRRLVATPS